jgi:hypothetical protein
VQTTHAAIQFTQEHPVVTNTWYTQSNYLVALVAPDEDALCKLIDKAMRMDITISIFREPDIGNAITAVCFEPSPATQKLLQKFPLLLNK